MQELLSFAISLAEAAVLRKGCFNRSFAVALCSGFFTRQDDRKSKRHGETCTGAKKLYKA